MSDPIGILDSGSGGLSIRKEIISLLPHESTVYIGDHLEMPYSNKTTAHIQNRVMKLIKFLLQKNSKIIVIACNTATVAGIDEYRRTFPSVPIVGVVPVIKTAATQTRSGRIAVLSTKYTSTSDYQKKLIDQFTATCSVQSIGSTRLVSLIEQKDSSLELHDELVKLLSTVKSDTDILVLGCTHFPFVQEEIRAIVGDGVKILDSGGAVSRQVKKILEHESLLESKKTPKHMFYTTGDEEYVSSLASRLLKHKVNFF